MDIEQKERLARLGDISPEAVHTRLLAARNSINMKQQDVAAAVGLKKTTFNSQEVRGAPSATSAFSRNYSPELSNRIKNPV